MKSGRNRAPPRRSETSSSLALAMGIPESASRPSVRDRVNEVSQSGLTQEVGFVVGLGFELWFLSMEDLMESGSGRVVGMDVGLRSGGERTEREEKERDI